MALTFSAPLVREDNDGFYVSLQAPSASVEVRVPVAAFSIEARSIQNKELLQAFERHRAKIETIANQKYDAKEFDERSDRKVIWITADSL